MTKTKLPAASLRTVNLVFSFVKDKYSIKRFTKKLFREICEAEGIILAHVPPEALEYLGQCGIYKDRKYISLRNNLPLKKYLQVAGHECGHIFLEHLGLTESADFGFHNPDGFPGLPKSKQEIIESEAHLFSALLRGKKQGGGK